MYVERIKYGRYVAKTKGETISGTNYCFPSKSGGFWIGGKHNYRTIGFAEYCFLSIKYFLLKKIFKSQYKKMIDVSWKQH